MDEFLTPTPLPGFLGTALQEWATAQPLLATIVVAVVLAVLSYVSYEVTRRLFIVAINKAVLRSKNKWDDALKNRRFFARLSHFVPLLIIRAGLPYMPALPDAFALGLQRGLAAVVVITFTRALVSLINAFGDVYATTSRAIERPIKGYLQVLIIVAYIVSGFLVIGMLLNRDPFTLLAGIGALSAVIMLIFQNTILSLVAGVQLTNNDLIRIGDWIEMPDMNADGDVVEIALNTVTVQNWDKTLTIIPTHNFLGKSFKNWRGMQVAGGRRIKRSIVIDMSTVRFLTEAEVEDLRRFALIRDYLNEKREDIGEWIEQNPAAKEDVVNSRRLTNLGTFRAYVTKYLRAHPSIAQDMTFLVRQLQPTSRGLPLEIYVFVNDTRWAVYEGVQADVFDHLIAIMSEFDLMLFQEPSGSDMVLLAEAVASGEVPQLPGSRVTQ